MSSSREIRSKISSVKNTQKITGAMELVAASKMRAARNRMEEVRPYAVYARAIIAHATKASIEYSHPYLNMRPVKRAGIVVVATDRGLCGGLNINLFKSVLNQVKQYKNDGVKVDLCLIGLKAESFFKRLADVNIVAVADFAGNKEARIEHIGGAVQVMFEAYDAKNIDEVILFSNEFVNTIRQKPRKQILLPISGLHAETTVDESLKGSSGLNLGAHNSDKPIAKHWDYIYEPDAQKVLDILFKRYVESQIYRGVVENLACEQAARMLAMKNATDNASDIIDSLKLEYNKARQAMITQELAEIVSGAAAV